MSQDTDALRGRLERFVAFVRMWTTRDNVTDTERLSAIGNHPLVTAIPPSGVALNQLSIKKDPQ